MTEIICRLARSPQRPERLALIRPDGSIGGHFRRDETREEIAASLAEAGYVLRDDDTVVRADA
jgi:hypothetical protein